MAQNGSYERKESKEFCPELVFEKRFSLLHFGAAALFPNFSPKIRYFTEYMHNIKVNILPKGV